MASPIATLYCITSSCCASTVLSVFIFIRYSHTDINECELNMDDCAVYANCSDTVGSYNCTCIFGYSGPGTECGQFTIHTHLRVRSYIKGVSTAEGLRRSIRPWLYTLTRKHV